MSSLRHFPMCFALCSCLSWWPFKGALGTCRGASHVPSDDSAKSDLFNCTQNASLVHRGQTWRRIQKFVSRRLFIWTILWTKIEMSISHEECYPLGMQMSLGCLRDQLLAVPASLPISLQLPLPSYVCLLAAMDLESAEAHAEQFSILKPQQINLSTENKFSSKQIRTGD